jgi:hypothetical protein
VPHQCLKCGKIFEDGSPELLKGCPHCGGNRFFYTKKALDENAREQIQKEVGKDINEQLVNMLGKQSGDLVDHAGNWVNMKPKDIRKALSTHIKEQPVVTKTPEESDTQEQQRNQEKIVQSPFSQYTLVEDESYRQEQLKRCLPQKNRDEHPETIGIRPPGEYEIDIKGLLEHQPIIIEKDGSYTIHLPSAFKQFQQKQEKNKK